MPLFQLQQQLQSYCSQKLQLEINDNRSTMLSVKWEPKCTKVSLHRMFLEAPESVRLALCHSIAKKQTIISPKVKAFIQQELQTIDHKVHLKRFQIDPYGEHYDLEKIYNGLNKEYFQQDLDLNISWYHSARQAGKNQITFGLYHEAMRLIKINRLMDSLFFPEYVVAFVVYHEMLHHACPTYVDAQGIHRIHHTTFKKREKEFREFYRAKDWIKEHQTALFESRSG